MQTLIQMIPGAVGTILFVLLAHGKIGKYPSPLSSTSPLRELLEAVLIWGISFVSITYVILAHVYDVYYPVLTIGNISVSLHLLVVLLVPFVVEVGIKKRGLKDLGFQQPVATTPWIAWVGFGIFFGVFAFVFERPDPYPVDGLLVGIITPAFAEEWLYRSVIQSKLERSLSQNKAWFISGILFGLSHIPTNFFGPLWVAGGRQISVAVVRLIGQCAFGWLWGILYMKCRSIFPGIAAHWLSDFLAGVLAYV